MFEKFKRIALTRRALAAFSLVSASAWAYFSEMSLEIFLELLDIICRLNHG